MSDDVAIRVRDLTVDGDRARLLDGVSVDVAAGERFGVVGGDAASRSAFAGALVGDVDPGHRVRGSVSYETPDGAVDVLDADSAERLRWRHVALVPSATSDVFPPVAGVGAMFEETLRAHGADVDEGMDRAEALLSGFGLDAARILESAPDEVGRGELELAALALALLLEPAVLVVDGSERSLRRLARRLPGGDDDPTVVAVAADHRLVGAFATRLAVLYDGEFVEVGPTEAVLDDPDHPYVRKLARLL